jgi:hypothetical protein
MDCGFQLMPHKTQQQFVITLVIFTYISNELNKANLTNVLSALAPMAKMSG